MHASPEWDRINETIRCPLCDYDLRSLIEPRCPECGYRFDWPDLLDPARRRHPFVFEHHPERNIWSAWKTCTAMLRPRRFWSSLHPSQPSQPKRLFKFWLYPVVAILLLSTPFTFWAMSFHSRALAPILARARSQQTAYWKAAAAATDPKSKQAAESIVREYGSIEAYLNIACPSPPTPWQLLKETITYFLPSLPAAAVVWSWPWMTFLSLMVFSISMQRRKLRPAHVMRAVIYSQDIFEPIVALWFAIATLPLLLASPLYPANLAGSALLLVFLLTLAIFSYRLIIAYRYYLQFDHPFLTILASQIISALGVLILFLIPALVFD